MVQHLCPRRPRPLGKVVIPTSMSDKKSTKKIERYKLDAAFVYLADYDVTTKGDDFMEVSMWHNGEGFDVNLNSNGDQRFCLTWGQYKALKTLVKELDG